MVDPRPNVASWFAGKDFTTDWLSGNLNVWLKVLAPLREQPVEILEIGSYEGRSAVAFLEYLGRSRITCIDSFHWPDHPTLGPAIEKRFDDNLERYSDRVTKIKTRAVPALDALSAENRSFDVIYLDAGKHRDGTFSQSASAWPLLKSGGIIIWDDLTWGRDKLPAERPEDAIRLFCSIFRDCLSILHEGNQMIARKTRDWPQSAPSVPSQVGGAPKRDDYWEQRKDCVYLREVFKLVRAVGADAKSIVDVGTNGCPYLERFDWIPRRISVDLSKPYKSETVEAITADFLKWPIPQGLDLCLCLQVLEHIPDATAFARKLLEAAPHVIVSVPYLWPANSCEWHVHDPVDEVKIEAWFGRPPDRRIIAREPGGGPHSRRLICYFAKASERGASMPATTTELDRTRDALLTKEVSSVAPRRCSTVMNVVKKPKVTIIITHHNYSEFIAGAIDSVLSQDYESFDCVIVDDKSDSQHERTLRQICEARASEKLRLLFNDTNLGQITSFYLGVDNTDADFVCLLDPDDRYLPGFIEEMVAAHLNPYAVVPMVCCDQIYGSAERQITGVSLSYGFPQELYKGVSASSPPEYNLSLHGTEKADWPWTSTSSMMFRRAAVRLMRPIAELQYKKAADAYLARGAQFLGGTLVFNKPLTVRTVHENNSWLAAAVVSASQRKFAPGALQMEPLCRMDVFISIIEGRGRDFLPEEHFHAVLQNCFDAEQRAAMAKRSPFVAELCSGRHQAGLAYEYYASSSRQWRRQDGWLVACRKVLSHVVRRVPISIIKLVTAPMIRPFSDDYFRSRVTRCHRHLKGAAGAVAGLFGSARP